MLSSLQETKLYQRTPSGQRYSPRFYFSRVLAATPYIDKPDMPGMFVVGYLFKGVSCTYVPTIDTVICDRRGITFKILF